MVTERVRAVNYTLRLTQEQHQALHSHLFPGDGCEAVALLLCGRRNDPDRHAFIVQESVLVPYKACAVRRPDLINWPTEFACELLTKAHGRGKAIVKIHSHGEAYRLFSRTDDASDRVLFSSITSLLDDGLPHASLIMLPTGEILGRVLGEDGQLVAPISSVMAVGDDLQIWEDVPSGQMRHFTERHAQAFGSATTARLGRLSAAVIGCSGTGSVVVEQLARLGIGKLVLIDPDVVEEKNLNRIVNATIEDAQNATAKVDVLTSAVSRMGLGTKVISLQKNLASREAILAAAACDIVFGCVDSLEGAIC